MMISLLVTLGADVTLVPAVVKLLTAAVLASERHDRSEAMVGRPPQISSSPVARPGAGLVTTCSRSLKLNTMTKWCMYVHQSDSPRCYSLDRSQSSTSRMLASRSPSASSASALAMRT
jgi:hypothetical protein